MDVQHLLSLMAQLSVGLDEPTEDDIPIYLNYINLAYAEIYTKTALSNPRAPLVREILDVTAGVLPDLQSLPYFIRKVWRVDRNFPLDAQDYDVLIASDPALTKTGDPRYWTYANNQITVYPLYAGQIGICYIPEPDELTEDTVETDIVLPKLFHSVLAHGGAYYLFQSEMGVKNQAKMMLAEQRWTMGQKSILAYFRALKGRPYLSTYSEV
jgi:hypothetical protein